MYNIKIAAKVNNRLTKNNYFLKNNRIFASVLNI